MPRYLKDLAMLALAIGFVAIGATLWFRPSNKPKTITLKMTAGDGSGLRHRLATEFSQVAAKSGIQIALEPTDGSEAALEKLRQGEFDIALVQGGLTNNQVWPIRQISALHIEPLHLLVKPELQSLVNEKGLSQLAGRKINLGAIGSGTHSLASSVLRFAGLRMDSEQGDALYHPNAMNYAELLTAEKGSLPDAVFTDLLMPVMDGFAFLGECGVRHPGLPVIVLSADIQAASRERALALGARGFLNKPFTAATLQDALAGLSRP